MTRSEEPARREAWRHELRTTGAWVRRTPPARMIGPGLGSLAFTVVCVGFLLVDSGVVRAVGVLGILVFGVWFLPTVVWRAVTGRPLLRLDTGGLVLDRVAVPWSEVTGLGFHGRGRGRTVVVVLSPAGVARRDAQSDLTGRWAVRAADRVMGAPGVGIPNGYGIPATELADWIAEVRRVATGTPTW